MTLEELRLHYKPQIEALAAKYHCSNVRVFGSIVRGTATGQSDVDFIVHPEKGASLFQLGGLWSELEELLEHRVDIVPDNARIRFPEILAEAVPL